MPTYPLYPLLFPPARVAVHGRETAMGNSIVTTIPVR